MKILFITHRFYPYIGGIEVNSDILAHAFHEAGEEVRLLTWTKEMGTKLYPFPVIRNPNLITLLKEHYWADVVYENNPCLRLSWPAVLINKPTVVALRTWINRVDGRVAWQDKVKIKWLNRAKSVIAVSDAVRRKCYPTATVIGNPYRKHLFRKLPDVARNKDFVFLGRLVSDKGADLAIAAFNKILINIRILNNVTSISTLTIIGDGPEKAQLEKMVADYGLKDNVYFSGPLTGENLVATLNQHRFILVPSIWEEPFGNVALEGMACGCLPIVSDGGGLPDAIGDAGIVFQRGNVDSLVSSILKVLINPQLEQQLNNAATLHLVNHHPELVAKKYLSVIQDAVN